MTLADSNIWVALSIPHHDMHPIVKSWFELLAPTNQLAFCRSTQQSFLRLVTTRSVLIRYGVPPLDNQTAWKTYQSLLADSRIVWLEEPEGLEKTWMQFTFKLRSSPKLWMDAYLAAFAIAGGYRLVTTDRAFGQFQGLQVEILEMES